jgi:hypothetical protein
VMVAADANTVCRIVAPAVAQLYQMVRFEHGRVAHVASDAADNGLASVASSSEHSRSELGLPRP